MVPGQRLARRPGADRGVPRACTPATTGPRRWRRCCSPTPSSTTPWACSCCARAAALDLHATEATHATLHRGDRRADHAGALLPRATGHPSSRAQDVSLGGSVLPGLRRADRQARPLRPSPAAGTGTGRVVGYRLTDERTGRRRRLPAGRAGAHARRARPSSTDCACLLVDGTCWHDDELIRLGLAAKTARDMGHLAIGGPGGSLEQLSPAADRAQDLRPHQQHQPDPARGLARAAAGRATAAWKWPRTVSRWRYRHDDGDDDSARTRLRRRERGGDRRPRRAAACALAELPQRAPVPPADERGPC